MYDEHLWKTYYSVLHNRCIFPLKKAKAFVFHAASNKSKCSYKIFMIPVRKMYCTVLQYFDVNFFSFSLSHSFCPNLTQTMYRFLTITVSVRFPFFYHVWSLVKMILLFAYSYSF